MIKLYIIKYFFIYNNYIKYNYLINEKNLKEENEFILLFYLVLKDFFARNPEQDIASVDQFEVLFHTAYSALPKKKVELVSVLFSRLRELDITEATLESYLEKLHNEEVGTQLALVSLDFSQGKVSRDEFTNRHSQLVESLKSSGTAGGTNRSVLHASRIFPFVDSHCVEGDRGIALNWRLQTLQKSLGPLQRGDFGFVYARPETGKSTFLADQGSFMVPQVETCVAWIANEERGAQYYNRILQAHLGFTHDELVAHPDEVREVYETIFKDKLQFIHNPDIHHRELYAFFKDVNPQLIIVDQLDKIGGFNESKKERYDLQLGDAYTWGRKMAWEFGPFIAASQASESGEGKQWLEMSDIANSKTGKPGEADWICGIGRSHNSAFSKVRFLHFVKNKLEGATEEYRHGKFEVLFNSASARYEDIMEWAK